MTAPPPRGPAPFPSYLAARSTMHSNAHMASGRMPNNSSPCVGLRAAQRLGRRQMLQVGTLGVLGATIGSLSLTDWLATRAQAAPTATGNGFGRAKRCIFLFMWGGPSQLDTFDMKPEAPAEIRGEFKPIATRVPGLQVCEHFSRLAQVTDKLAVIRSLHHNDPAHLSSGHVALTGHYAPTRFSDNDPPSSRDTPHIGSVISRLMGQANSNSALPTAVTMPWQAFHPAAPGGKAPGQHGGWLGRKFDPFLVGGDPSQAGWKVDALGLDDDLSLDRLNSRRGLLDLIDGQRDHLDRAAALEAMSSYKQQAIDLISSTATRQAFDLSQETDAMRDRYGRNIHGQCVLLARRLVEQGVPLVSVNWHNDGSAFWDTHGNNFNRLKNDLIPPADQALAALISDLDERGMLDDTIIAWVGEFGRRPQISSAGAGREHWPRCYSGLLAGGGIRGGAIYGSSDPHASRPKDLPTTPQDYIATIYHALGIDTTQMLSDPFGRPLRFCDGNPLTTLFG